MTLSPGFQVFTSFREPHAENRRKIASTTARKRIDIGVSHHREPWISSPLRQANTCFHTIMGPQTMQSGRKRGAMENRKWMDFAEDVARGAGKILRDKQ